MGLVTYIEHDGTRHEIHLENGQSIMQGAMDNMIEGIIAECGGCCSCATCHCYVEAEWLEKTDGANETEKVMLEAAVDPESNSRLSCQIQMSDELDGLVIRLPESQF